MGKHDECDEVKHVEAIAMACEIEKLLQSKGIWFTRSNINQGTLRYIKFEASIKVMR